MYRLYAEDTRTKDSRFIRELRSKRFSRAKREMDKEPQYGGCRLYMVPALKDGGRAPQDARVYAHTNIRKPAPVGSPENQAHQRNQLAERKRRAPRRSRPLTDEEWNERDDMTGEILSDVMVDIYRERLDRGAL